MARTIFSMAQTSGGAVGGAATIDATNGMSLDLTFIGPAIDKFGLFFLVYNSAGTTYNVVIRKGIVGSYGGADFTAACTNGAVTVVGPIPVNQLLNGLGDSRQGLWVDFSNTSFTGTIIPVCGLRQDIPANTAANASLKSLPGALLAAMVTTAAVGGTHIFYDNGAPYATGSQLGSTIANNAAIGANIVGPFLAAKGIVSAGVASGPAVTAFYV